MIPGVSLHCLLGMSSNVIGLYVLLGLAALFGAFLLIVIIVGLCERQHLTGDVEPSQPPYPYSPSAYWEATRKDAIGLGLRHAGDFATKKNTTVVKGLQSMFISADNQVIVSIVGGSFAATKLKKTVLRSKFFSGRFVESSDNPGSVPDFSGVVDRKVLLNAGIAELLNFHLERLRNATGPLMALNRQGVLEKCEKIERERCEG